MIRVYLLLLVSLFQSCALLTSHDSFTIKKNLNNTFERRMAFANTGSYTLLFFKDGSCLLVKAFGERDVEKYLKKIEYDIYKKWSSDPWFHWGVYEIVGDTINMEFLEKIDQWGFMGICGWSAIRVNESSEIRILAGPNNRKLKELNFYPLPNEEVILKETDQLENLKVDSRKAWVNR